jgi:hypothetical protein
MVLKRIEVVAKAYQDSIVLRWAPNDHVYWALTKNEPYAVFKVVASKDPSSSEAEYILLDSVKPWTLEMFTPQMVAKDSLILVAAQSLYGAQESSDSRWFDYPTFGERDALWDGDAWLQTGLHLPRQLWD